MGRITGDRSGVAGDAQKLYKAMKGLGTDESAIFRVLYSKDAAKNRAVAREFLKLSDGESLLSWLDDEMDGFDFKKAKHLLKYGEMRLSMKIVQACAGMGTDEKTLIREFKKVQSSKSKLGAGGAEGVKAKEPDKQRAEVNRNELNSKSDFKGDTSDSFLSWGVAVIENRSTELVDELRIYTEGWGTDEKGLYDCVQGWAKLPANKGKGALIAANPKHKVMVELKSELSGEEFLKAKELLLRDGELGVWRKLKLAAEGWGTDEAAIIAAIESMTEKAKNTLLADAQDSQGAGRPAVLRLLRGELSGRDLAKAEALLDTSMVNAEAYDKLKKLVEGTGDTELLTKLKAAREAPGKIEPFRDYAIEKLWGQSLADILNTAETALPGKRLLDVKHKLIVAIAGWGSDKEGVYKALGSITAGQRQKLAKDAELLRKLKSEMSQAWYDICIGMLSENVYTRTLSSMKAGMKGAGTDEDFLFKSLEQVPKDKRAGIFPRVDEELSAHLRLELNPAMFKAIDEALKNPADTSKLGPEVRLKVATEMRAGTDEDAIKDIIGELKGAKLLEWTNWGKIKGKQRASDPPHLQMAPDKRALIESELGSADLWADLDAFRAKLNSDGEALRIMKGHFLARFKGKPKPGEPPEQSALNFFQIIKACGDFQHIRDAVDHERSGGASAAVMDTLGTSGYELEDAVNNYEATLEKAVKDEKLDKQEKADVQSAKSDAEKRLSEYKAAKGAIASWAATIVAVIVGSIITVLTAGAGSGIAALMITGALAAGGGAVAGNVAKWLIMGDSMDWEKAGIEIATAVLIGALTGALQKLVQGLTAGSKLLNVDTFMKSFKEAQKLTWGQFAKKIAVANIEAQIENLVTSIPASVLATLLEDPENFRKILLDPLEKLVKPQVEQMGAEALTTMAKTTLGELRKGRAGGAVEQPKVSTRREVADAMATEVMEGGIDLLTDENLIRKGEIEPMEIAKIILAAIKKGTKTYAKHKGNEIREKKANEALKASGMNFTDEEMNAYMADQASYLKPPDPKIWREQRWPRIRAALRTERLKQAKLDEKQLKEEAERHDAAEDRAIADMTQAEIDAEKHKKGTKGHTAAQERLSEAKANYDSTAATSKTAKAKLERQRRTLKREQSYNDAFVEFDEAKKIHTTATSDLSQAEEHLKGAQASLDWAIAQGNVIAVMNAKRAFESAESQLTKTRAKYQAAKTKLQAAQQLVDQKDAGREFIAANRTYNSAMERLKKAERAVLVAKQCAQDAADRIQGGIAKKGDTETIKAVTDAIAAQKETAVHLRFAEDLFTELRSKITGTRTQQQAADETQADAA
jgi:hypothetical protein